MISRSFFSTHHVKLLLVKESEIARVIPAVSEDLSRQVIAVVVAGKEAVTRDQYFADRTALRHLPDSETMQSR